MKHLSKVTFGICLVAMLAVSPETVAAPITTPNVVYVSDFDLEIAQVQQSRPGSVVKPVPLLLRLRNGGYGPPPIRRTPEQQARDLVDLMSRSLLDDLRQAGLSAQRLPPGAPLPPSGWLIHGAFLEADADGRLLRVVTGFGAGSTQLQLVAAVDQLDAGAPQPLYTIDRTAPGGKLSGAVVTLNPDIALMRFVLAGLDRDRNIKGSAAEIAEHVATLIVTATSKTR